MSTTLVQHLNQLTCLIGPRGSATRGEQAGHEYVFRQFEAAGCRTRVEPFRGIRSGYMPFILGLGLLLAAAISFIASPKPLVAAASCVVMVLVYVSHGLELAQKKNLLRALSSHAESRNVIGITPARSEVKRRVALLAHVDSHRTPWIFASPRAFQVYRGISLAAMLATLALAALSFSGIWTDSPRLRWFAGVAALPILTAFIMVLQAHASRFTVGANDNASGVAAMLLLTARTQQTPLLNTEIWWVATGCEEVGADGSAEFVRRHGDKFRDGLAIVIDNIAGKDCSLAVPTSETLLLKRVYPASVLALARRAAERDPSRAILWSPLVNAYSDASPFLKADLPALTVMAFTPAGWIPHWHQPSDRLGNLDLDLLHSATEFIWDLLLEADAAGA